MLTSTMLEKCTHSYRRGYQSGFNVGEKKDIASIASDGTVMRPFADFDFKEGYNAGINDFFWNQFSFKHIRENREALQLQQKEFMTKYAI